MFSHILNVLTLLGKDSVLQLPKRSCGLYVRLDPRIVREDLGVLFVVEIRQPRFPPGSGTEGWLGEVSSG